MAMQGCGFAGSNHVLAVCPSNLGVARISSVSKTSKAMKRAFRLRFDFVS